MSWENIGTLFGMLLSVAVVLVLAYLFTRYLAGRGISGGAVSHCRGKYGGYLQVLERVSLGREQNLVLARAGGQYLLLGVSPGGITLLRELSEDEAQTWRQQHAPAASPGASMGFQDALREVWKQRKK